MNSAPNDWYPEPDDEVNRLAVSGDVVVIGGNFTLINYDDSGQYEDSEVARNYLAAFSIDANGDASSTPNDFAPRVKGGFRLRRSPECASRSRDCRGGVTL